MPPRPCSREGTFRVSGAAELRVKESDRIAAIVEGFSRLGADITEHPDGLEIRGGKPLRAATVRAHDDHRIAMSLAVAALAAEGETEIEGAECASVSFPEFYEFLARGAQRDDAGPRADRPRRVHGRRQEHGRPGPRAAAGLDLPSTWTPGSRRATAAPWPRSSGTTARPSSVTQERRVAEEARGLHERT